MRYDAKDPRSRAAHEAGEKTAKALLGVKSFTFSPEYLAMAIVQDALMAYEKADSSAVGP